MSTTLTDFSKMTKIQKYQHFTRRKFQQVENEYYPLIDELTEKMADLREVQKIPDFTLYTFSFLKDWQHGVVDTGFVLAILRSMDLKDVAEKQLTRRLTNFILSNEGRCPVSCEYVKDVRDQLIQKAVPLYETYLSMLVKFFQKMHEIDQSQIRLTWLEQTFRHNGEVSTEIRDVTLNQAFRELQSNVICHNTHKYIVGNNLIVFDEDLADEDLACHWIFAPKTYIEQLKTLFQVEEKMDLKTEKDYIKKLIGAYVK